MGQSLRNRRYLRTPRSWTRFPVGVVIVKLSQVSGEVQRGQAGLGLSGKGQHPGTRRRHRIAGRLGCGRRVTGTHGHFNRSSGQVDAVRKMNDPIFTHDRVKPNLVHLDNLLRSSEILSHHAILSKPPAPSHGRDPRAQPRQHRRPRPPDRRPDPRTPRGRPRHPVQGEAVEDLPLRGIGSAGLNGPRLWNPAWPTEIALGLWVPIVVKEPRCRRGLRSVVQKLLASRLPFGRRKGTDTSSLPLGAGENLYPERQGLTLAGKRIEPPHPRRVVPRGGDDAGPVRAERGGLDRIAAVVLGWYWCQFVFPVKKRTDIAPRSSGKENRYNRETFQMEPCG